MNTLRKVLAVLLCLSLCLSLAPAAFAEEPGEEALFVWDDAVPEEAPQEAPGEEEDLFVFEEDPAAPAPPEEPADEEELPEEEALEKNGMAPIITGQPADVSAPVDETATFTVTVSGDGLSYQWQVTRDGGVLWDDSDEAGSKTKTLSVAVTEEKDGYQYRCIVTNSVGSVTSGAAKLTVVPALPEITQQPEDVSSAVSTNVTFTVKAKGVDAYKWQYSKDGGMSWSKSPAAGNTTDTLTVPVTLYRDGYQYRCILYNKTGSVTSDVATLTVIQAVKITAQPVDVSGLAGETAVFAVAAKGGDLSYQWKVSKDGGSTWSNSPADGNKTATLTVPITKSRNGYQYRCVVKNSVSSVTSNAATLTLLVPPEITVQPEKISAAPDSTVNFTITAVGADSYQWQVSTDGSTWNDCTDSGSTTAVLSVPVTAAKDGWQYRCVVTNKAGSVESDPAALSILSEVVITANPKDVTVYGGKTAEFTVAASGGELSYQWQYSVNKGAYWKNSPAAGNTTDTLSVPGTLSRNGYQYRCIVSNPYGSVASSAATLTVIGKPVVTADPSDVSASKGLTVYFTVAADGAESYRWQYSKDGGSTWHASPAAGNDTDTLTIPVTQYRDGYQYRCKVTNGAGSVFSAAAKLTVLTDIAVDAANFPDAVFLQYVKDNIDTDKDLKLSPEEIAAVTAIDLYGKGAGSLQGIGFFTSLTQLYCGANSLTALDLSNNTALTLLSCPGNQLTSLNLTGNALLNSVWCQNNKLASLDLSGNPALGSLNCEGNSLTTLDLTKCPGCSVTCDSGVTIIR